MPLPFGRGQLTPAMRPLGHTPIFHDCTSGTLRHPSRSSLAEAGGNRLLSPCTDHSFACRRSRIRTDDPPRLRWMLYPTELFTMLERRARSGVSYLVRHKMRRAILPFPIRGYQTANPDGVPELAFGAETRMAGTKLSQRYGRTTIPTLRLSPLSLSRELCGERSPRGPQHSPSVLSSGLQDQPPTFGPEI
jgi:hypothetical protein